MPDTRPKTPSYRLHKPTRQAVVTIGGRDFYLGKHGTKASCDEYDRLVAEWLANGRRLPSSAGGRADLSIVELIAAYLEHAKAYYRKDGRPTSEQACIKSAMRPLRRLYGKTPAAELTPLKVKAVRQVMLEADWSRGHVNDQVDRIKRLFKWAAENELVPAGVYHGLQAVSGLRKGRSDARETEPVRPVPDEYVDAIEPYVSAAVWAMVELQRLTGMRSGEVSIMRGRDLDTGGELWLYRPSSHKTEHHGHERVVELGPRSQAVLSPLLRRNLDAYLFSPAEAESKRNAERRRDRKTPMTPSQAGRTRKRKRSRAPQDRYTPDSYRRCVTRACERAGVPPWHPHQLRHNFGTRIRKQFGLDAARSALGHRSLAMADQYAELDRALASKVALEVG